MSPRILPSPLAGSRTGGPVGSSFRGLGPAHMAMPQGDVLTASSSRGGGFRRRTRARGLHAAGPRDVFAACGNTRRARVEPILASWNESGTNPERLELSWNESGTFCERLIAR